MAFGLEQLRLALVGGGLEVGSLELPMFFSGRGVALRPGQVGVDATRRGWSYALGVFQPGRRSIVVVFLGTARAWRRAVVQTALLLGQPFPGLGQPIPALPVRVGLGSLDGNGAVIPFHFMDDITRTRGLG